MTEAIEDLLDHWEDHLLQDADADLDRFLTQRGGDLSESQRRAFRSRAEQIRRINASPAFDTGDTHSADQSNTRRQKESAPRTPPLMLSAGVEIVPGYRLIEPLGRGGYGEVWKAAGPGEVEVALKVIHRDGDAMQAEKRSLEVIRGIRHANLLSISAFWSTPTSLIIASELADQTLADRLDEVVGDQPGIEPAELHEYMREAAKGIDYLNRPDPATGQTIQHRDIKPQNLLLVGGSVKVSDYGLARVLHQDSTGHTGSMTLAYAAPEWLNGRTCQTGDQYSLAVTYCHLRGGRLPFTGTPMQVMRGHAEEQPDLSMIPEAERGVVAKALAKQPEERWGSCGEFVEQLTSSTPRTQVRRVKERDRPLETEAGRSTRHDRRLFFVWLLFASPIMAYAHVEFTSSIFSGGAPC